MRDYFLWEAPEGKFSILVPRSVLERLKTFAEEALSGAFAPTGAVLIGHSEEGVITVENFERGVSRLHDDGVVGFVRCRRQTALHLEESDFLALRSGPGLVCLMVRPDGDGGAVGGFFYREGKTVRWPTAPLQFPIDGAANDCRGSISAAPEEVEKETGVTARRVVYAAVGLALILSPVAVWLMGR